MWRRLAALAGVLIVAGIAVSLFRAHMRSEDAREDLPREHASAERAALREFDEHVADITSVLEVSGPLTTSTADVCWLEESYAGWWTTG